MGVWVLAAAMIGQAAVGQTVALGRPGGLQMDAPAAAGVSPEALIEYTVTSTWDRPLNGVDVCMVSYGTAARVIDKITLSRRVEDVERSEPGLKVTILDGPLAGVTGFVRETAVHEAVGRPAPSTTTRGTPPNDAEVIELKSAKLGDRAPVFGTATPDDLADFLASRHGPRSVLPPSVVGLGGRVKARVISPIAIPERNAPLGHMDGLLVQIAEGLAKGRNLVVLQLFADDGPAIEAEAPPAASGGSSLSDRRREELAETARRNHERRASRYKAGRARDAAMAQEAKEAAAKAAADFKAALPFLLEDQRQKLQRMSSMERNAALMQMAKSNKAIADAIQYRAYVNSR